MEEPIGRCACAHHTRCTTAAGCPRPVPGGRVTAMILYLDCANGISGDMLVAALLAVSGTRPDDPGVLEDVVRPALAAAGIDPRLVSVAEERRGGFAAFAFQVADGPGFATFDELIMSMYASDLEQPVADAVASIAERMAAAEAEVHGRGEEHLHELSNVDTAIDLICAVALLHRLAPERVVASPPALGGGTVDTAHGVLSVPAPAVLSLLAGLPTAGAGTESTPCAVSTVPPPSAGGEATTLSGASRCSNATAQMRSIAVSTLLSSCRCSSPRPWTSASAAAMRSAMEATAVSYTHLRAH